MAELEYGDLILRASQKTSIVLNTKNSFFSSSDNQSGFNHAMGPVLINVRGVIGFVDKF